LAAFPTGAGSTTRGSRRAKEGLKNVTEGAEPAELITSGVVALALFGVAQDLVGVGDEFELLFRALFLIHIGVKLARKLPVGTANIFGTGIAGNAENLVMVNTHAGVSSVEGGPPRIPDR